MLTDKNSKNSIKLNGMKSDVEASENDILKKGQNGDLLLPVTISDQNHLNAARSVGKTSGNPVGRWWQGLGLRTKTTLVSVAAITIPLLALGGVAYFYVGQNIANTTQQDKAVRASALATRVAYFMRERYGDIQVLANLPIFNNPKFQATVTIAEQKAILEAYIKAYLVYDSIAIYRLDGSLIVDAGSEPPPANIFKREYFQTTLKTDKPYISQPEPSVVTKKVSNFIAAPIKDVTTGKTIAIIRTRMQASVLEDLIKDTGVDDNQYHLVESDGKFFVALEKEQVGRSLKADFPGIAPLLEKREVGAVTSIDLISNNEQFVGYAPLPKIEGLPDLKWDAVIAIDTSIANKPQLQLLLILGAATGAVAILASALALLIANRATRPIIRASNAVEKLGQGELDTRIEGISGDDELAVLGTNINIMASQIQTLIDEQAAAAERKNLVATIASQLRQSLDLNTILETLVREAKTALNAERVVIYRFNPDWSGYLSHEAVSPGLPSALAEKATDPCIPQTLLEAYRNGRIVPTNDMQERDYHPDHRALLARLAIKANLVIPIVQQNQLFGLLVAHHCTQTHVWLDNEIDFMTQLAGQAGSAIGQATFVEQIEVARVEARREADQTAQEQRQEKETLQKRALELLMEVDPVSKGDLTVRAKVTADEIGTLADSYNSIIRSLRQIVEQVQTASQSVVTTTQGNEMAVASAATESSLQAKSITNALSQIQTISESIQGVASRAKQAEQQVQKSNLVVQAGDEAMNRTVTGISAIRETVSETSKKVKRLGEASQKISKVVNLIGNFAAQTNLLALNAAIEAARAGEEGRGFAVVAEEVRALAQQSASATADIEQLVEEIQAQTNEVVAAMEAGTEQVVVGTQLVEESRQKLSQISEVSAQVNKLVQEISLAAAAQTQTSASVSQTMQDVATSAQDASEQSATVASSFKQLLEVAKALQVSVGQFKLS